MKWYHRRLFFKNRTLSSLAWHSWTSKPLEHNRLCDSFLVPTFFAGNWGHGVTRDDQVASSRLNFILSSSTPKRFSTLIPFLLQILYVIVLLSVLILSIVSTVAMFLQSSVAALFHFAFHGSHSKKGQIFAKKKKCEMCSQYISQMPRCLRLHFCHAW